MKQGKYIFFLFFLLTCSLTVSAQCQHKSNSELRSLLGLYFYDAYHYSDFAPFTGLQFQEFQLKTFSSSQYKLAFDASQAHPTLKIEVFDKAGNRDSCSFNITVNFITAVQNVIGDKILIYPNPTNDLIHLKTSKNINWTIVSLTGKIMFEGNQKDIDLSNLNAGTYLIKINAEDSVTIDRIIKL